MTKQEFLYKKYSQKVFDVNSSIPLLWESLGVTQEYKYNFVKTVMDLDVSIMQEFLEYEGNNLRQLFDNLKVTTV